ncbi:hypothetical protein DX130_24665 [Paenibacillus paeoniae]|uniref:Uncharacterized protein n=1 Tax=Paenibacillus paeoniae TaxID=2292705 RepID=A0A371P092_9BACL|nr:hypothetical protein DX130_24665 [Paenibacillus paeoniae]
MKCTTCSKAISGKYRIAGKPYGYDCYRLKLTEIRAAAELAAQEERNAEHALKCSAAMAVFSGLMYRSEWLVKFQASIIQQWEDCRKLTAKQLSVILTKIDEVDYGLTSRWLQRIGRLLRTSSTIWPIAANLPPSMFTTRGFPTSLDTRCITGSAGHMYSKRWTIRVWPLTCGVMCMRMIHSLQSHVGDCVYFIISTHRRETGSGMYYWQPHTT